MTIEAAKDRVIAAARAVAACKSELGRCELLGKLDSRLAELDAILLGATSSRKTKAADGPVGFADYRPFQSGVGRVVPAKGKP